MANVRRTMIDCPVDDVPKAVYRWTFAMSDFNSTIQNIPALEFLVHECHGHLNHAAEETTPPPGRSKAIFFSPPPFGEILSFSGVVAWLRWPYSKIPGFALLAIA